MDRRGFFKALTGFVGGINAAFMPCKNKPPTASEAIELRENASGETQGSYSNLDIREKIKIAVLEAENLGEDIKISLSKSDYKDEEDYILSCAPVKINSGYHPKLSIMGYPITCEICKSNVSYSIGQERFCIYIN